MEHRGYDSDRATGLLHWIASALHLSATAGHFVPNMFTSLAENGQELAGEVAAGKLQAERSWGISFAPSHALTCAPGTTAFQVISAGRSVGRTRGLADAQPALIGLPRTAPRLRSCGCPAPPASTLSSLPRSEPCWDCSSFPFRRCLEQKWSHLHGPCW